MRTRDGKSREISNDDDNHDNADALYDINNRTKDDSNEHVPLLTQCINESQVAVEQHINNSQGTGVPQLQPRIDTQQSIYPVDTDADTVTYSGTGEKQKIYLSPSTACSWYSLQSKLGFTSDDEFAKWMVRMITNSWPLIKHIPRIKGCKLEDQPSLQDSDTESSEADIIRPVDSVVTVNNMDPSVGDSNEISESTGSKSYTCDTCQKTFATSYQHKQHKYTHQSNSERPYICDVCHKGFIKPFTLKEHMRMHTGEKPHDCPFCPKKFATTSTRNVHMRKHTGEKPYECNMCDKAYATSHQLKDHQITNHVRKTHALMVSSKSGETNLSCPLCYSVFGSVGELVVHTEHHDERYRPLLCDICGKSFTKRQHMVAHRRTHTGEKPYACNSCGKSYADPSAYRRHRKSHGHVGDECAVCKVTFTDKVELKNHVLLQHAGDAASTTTAAVSDATSSKLTASMLSPTEVTAAVAATQHQQQVLQHEIGSSGITTLYGASSQQIPPYHHHHHHTEQQQHHQQLAAVVAAAAAASSSSISQQPQQQAVPPQHNQQPPAAATAAAHHIIMHNPFMSVFTTQSL